MYHAERTKEEEEKLRSFFKDEDSEQIQKDLEYLRDWLEKQPHLPHDIDDNMLLNFLRGRKYSLEDTKTKLDKFYTYRGILPEYCQNLDPLLPEVKFSMEHKVFCIAPGYTPDGYRLLIMSYRDVDPATFDCGVVFKRMVCCYDTLLGWDTLKRGTVVICDMNGLKAGHALKITFPHMKKGMTLLEQGYPDQFKKVFVLGLNPMSAKVMNLVIHCLPQKLKERFVFLSDDNLEQLHEMVPKKMLPTELDGTAGTLFEVNERWNQELYAKRDWLVELGKKKVNENRRPGKPKKASDLLGMEGSFRQLSMD